MLTEINPNISINNSKEEFLKSGLNNPKTITEDISKQTNQFESLKFQYLEQEARDKFLRVLLNNDPITIKHEELNKTQIETQQTIQQETMLTLEMNEKQSQVDEMTKELLDLNDKFNEKYQRNMELLKKMEHLEKEIDFMDVDKYLLDEVELDNFTSLEDYIRTQNEKVYDGKALLRQLDDDIKYKNQKFAEQSDIISELNQVLNDLLLSNNHSIKSENNNIGKWINEINKILSKFTTVKFDIVINEVIEIIVGSSYFKLEKSNLSLIESNCSIDPIKFDTEDRIDSISKIIVELSS
ncbi:hypothetical protein CLIB1444_09S01684 [[Candida] jaroonii]|uniref:Uncharacterized protein n=1 Tax=[Candida] jaroonii TaxID=467808 RepID=A0ACA9YBR4_9ASCO|nr:hypothetical protein CLIB1444_09S01684 [[Candida] jaroonii]